ncbi:phosphate ABC transporter permease subunit PstC [Allorhizobium taibaishanense]|uniref:Phosphate transport system permease protein n=1 Tax=Allorhizobium taibaishanense TaxID=887144 RepID=A0A1Q9A8U9_9HYPH|nr:phosphate ABC transporter permease subunit PstC [Allorhizobium taibaishanense]MBB4009460.1 phosphate transport system permease protein [Allorhizobium taibaishanense]OLP50998.1 phosphate ABC transporter permease subunit PstC [Allorhizobium taibaishanense]
MSTSILIFIVIAIAIIGYLMGSSRAVALAQGRASALHSRYGYHGSFVSILAAVPALLLLGVWMSVAPALIETRVRDAMPDEVKAQAGATQNLNYGTVNAIARGMKVMDEAELAKLKGADGPTARTLLAEQGVPLASDPEPYMITAAESLNGMRGINDLALAVVVIAVSLAGALLGLRMIAPRFRARNRVEQAMLAALIICSSIAILTTIGIILSMLSEAVHFFQAVPAWRFFFGTVWDPRFSAAGATDTGGQFGLIPLLLGTMYIGVVAMLFAVPVGLFAAIYMAEYASPRMRSIIKPMLEVLAGIPTIVYGFFALTSVGPFLRDISAKISGIATGDFTSFIQAQSVLTAGFVMGIMLIPYVSSLSDDIITAVPRSLRDGSLGLGATRSETVKRVILPAALPGIVGALLMTASRAIGETMIVVLAAGVAARIQFNPFEPMTTVTVKIVNQLTGDLEFTSPQTLVAFALGITLFVITLCLNIYALYIVRKYREQYE